MSESFEPSLNVINKYIETFDQNEKNKEAVLLHAFRKNSLYEDYLTQIFLLNTLYGTHLDDDSIEKVSKMIHDNKLVDVILKNVDYDMETKCEVVHKIADVGDKNFISFASKFCNWTCLANDPEKKETYPIIDKYTRGMVWTLSNNFQNEPLKKYLLFDYKHFCKHYLNAHKKFAKRLSFKDFDKFLWLYGKRNNIFLE